MLEYGIVSALPDLETTLATEFYEGPGTGTPPCVDQPPVLPESHPSVSRTMQHKAWLMHALIAVTVGVWGFS